MTLKVYLKSSTAEFVNDTGLSWPVLVFEQLGYKGFEGPPVLEDRAWFGSRVWSMTRLQEEIDSGKATLGHSYAIAPTDDSSGRFLSVDGLTELHYQAILEWAIKSDFGRPQVYWVADKNPDYNSEPEYEHPDNRLELDTGAAEFIVAPSSKLFNEFGVPWSINPNTSTLLLTYAFAKFFLGTDGVFEYGNDRGYIFRGWRDRWTIAPVTGHNATTDSIEPPAA
jgi:hypothetical protein